MANLTAKFKLIDEMSSKMEAIATSGKSVLESWEKIGETADAASKTATTAADGVARSMKDYGSAADEATSKADYWTEAVGNYDKGALEAIYSTEELVEMGFKTADALEEEARAAEKASEETEEFGDEAEKSGNKGKDAAEQLAGALTAAGITKLLHDITEGFMEVSEAAAEFETAVMKISTVADTSNVSLSTISSDILELSSQTGISVGELSEATYSAISASVDTAKAVEFTGTATKLAAGGFTSSATAVDVLTTALNAYGLEADQASNISDMLITTQNLGKTTVDELASSVGKVIPLASAYGVEMDNLSSAYAELTKGGIATAEAGTYLKAMLNELGKSSSTVATTLKDETGMSFAELSEKGYSLGDVMAILGDSVNGNATAFSGLWSSTEAGVGALSLYNAGAEQFNSALNAMQTSVGATQKAYDAMTNTTQHAQEELTNASENLKISIGENINPLFTKMYKVGTDVTNWMSKFAKEHPILTKALAAITIGVGVAAAGMVAYTFATTTAIPAITAFGVAANAALGPIGWISLALTGVVAAGAALIAMFGDVEDEYEQLSYSSKVQKDELDSLQAQYDEACEKFGETSYQAQELQWQIDELTGEYESNKQTLEEWVAEFDEAMSSYRDFDKERENSINATEIEGDKILNLATRLETLANKTDRSAAEQQEMLAIIERLNGEVPGLSINYDELTGKIDGSTDAIIALAEAEVARRKYEGYSDELIKSIEKRADLQDTLNKATQQYNDTLKKQTDAQAEYDAAVEARRKADAAYTKPKGGGEAEGRAYAQYIQGYANAVNTASDALEKVNGEVEAAKGRVDEATGAIEDNEAAISGVSEKMAALTNQSADAMKNAEDVNGVIDAMAMSVSELAAEYDEAYQAAKTSFDGQFGLFDEAQANMDATVANAQKALDSQLKYWEDYATNINVLKQTSASDLGVTQETYNQLMAVVQDGSAEAAGLAQSMVTAIKNGDEEAVAKLAGTLEKVNAKKDEAASTVAEWQIDFNGKMDEIVKKAEDAITNMNLTPEADKAARATMNSYANAILTQGATAIANAQSIANQVKAALSSTNVTVPTTGKGYAEGTDYATPGPHLVGENGPEIVEFRGGEKVYTNDETERIMARTAATKFFAQADGTQTQETLKTESGDNKRTIRLEINGAGALEVNGATDEETVVAILQSHLKPILTGIVKQEIYEEGEQSYDF